MKQRAVSHPMFKTNDGRKENTERKSVGVMIFWSPGCVFLHHPISTGPGSEYRGINTLVYCCIL